MMKKLSLLPILALLLAVAANAFTPNQNSDLVWFEVDPVTGEALNETDGGLQGAEPAISCPDGNRFCARALSISQGEVVDNMNGTYGISTGTDITKHFNAERKRN